jgi:aquaporin Z
MKLLTEFVGSFLFMFAIALAATSGSPMAPLAIGVALVAMVYMGGAISGAHYNPAVTIAVMMRGKIDAKDVGPYITAQLAGAVAAFFAGYYATGKALRIAPGEGVQPGQALLVEVLFTLMLVLVILNVATVKRTSGNQYYGLAIGFTIVAAAFAGGGISGGAFNPAVGVGSTLVDAAVAGGSFANVWLYIVGPVLGAGLAAFLFKAQHTPDEQA